MLAATSYRGMLMAERTLLHVDDDPELTALVQQWLAKYQMRTIPVNDPAQAMKQLERTRARLVLLDVDMPGKNGLELLQEIKQFDGTILVVMLTGLVGQTTVIRSLRSGAEACFFKPVRDIQPLVACLEDCFRKIDRWWKCLSELVERKRSLQGSLSG